ncbi:MAG TPA: PIN domain-containing protein [Polyangiaceae bacterium]
MILFDTGPLVALCDDRDGLHERALDEVDRLPSAPRIVLSAVLTEACFLLESGLLRRRLSLLLEKLELEALPDEPTPAFRALAFAWLERYAEHEPDYADACLAVAAGRQAFKVWTFDSEFATTWRRPDGRKIPLAVQTPGMRSKKPARRR